MTVRAVRLEGRRGSSVLGAKRCKEFAGCFGQYGSGPFGDGRGEWAVGKCPHRGFAGPSTQKVVVSMCYSQEAKEDKAHSLEPNGLELGKAKEEIKEKVQQLMRAADEKAVADVMKDSCGW